MLAIVVGQSAVAIGLLACNAVLDNHDRVLDERDTTDARKDGAGDVGSGGDGTTPPPPPSGDGGTDAPVDARVEYTTVSVDPTSWQATPIGTGTGYNNIFGLGFWAGKIYGFVDDKTNHTGKIIVIDPNTGSGSEVLSANIEWYGAGVTTDAPVISRQ